MIIELPMSEIKSLKKHYKRKGFAHGKIRVYEKII